MEKKSKTLTETKKYFCIPTDVNTIIEPDKFEEKFEDYKIKELSELEINLKIDEVNFQRKASYFERLKKDKFIIAELIKKETGKFKIIKINYYGIY